MKDLEAVTFVAGVYRYTCRDCTHTWDAKGT
jgi:hypothetical protein